MPLLDRVIVDYSVNGTKTETCEAGRKILRIFGDILRPSSSTPSVSIEHWTVKENGPTPEGKSGVIGDQQKIQINFPRRTDL